MAALLVSACVTTTTGDFGEKKDPQKALKLSIELARNYIEAGDWEAAKRNLKTALSIDDHSPAANEALGMVFWRTGEFKAADSHFRKAIDYADKNDISRIRNNYAAFLYSRQRYTDAELQLEKVAKDLLYDGRPAALLNLGIVRMKLKKYAQAGDVLEQSFLMDRTNPTVKFQLAKVYFKLGNYAKSQSYYDAYRNQVHQPSAESLWLGIRLAKQAGNENALASYALALKNLFPLSEEYQAYKREYSNAGTQH